MRYKSGIEHDFQPKRDDLGRTYEEAHSAYYQTDTFNGPSLYFHQQALLAADGECERFAQCAYGVLASWGMHRMGPGGSKMREFAEFQASLKVVWSLIVRLRKASPESLDKDGWHDLRRIFIGLRCMASATSLVGNSKVMAHALPHLVPPVDRRYTLRFLFDNEQITNGIDGEWEMLETILRGFFYPVLRWDLPESKQQAWMNEKVVFKWDTSPLKIVDNLLIGFSKVPLTPQGKRVSGAHARVE